MLLGKIALVMFSMSLIVFNPITYSIGAEIFISKTYQSDKIAYCRNDILLYGNIEIGDYEKFLEAIRRIKKKGCVIKTVHLLSHGGDVLEAIKIGSKIRENLLSTNAPDHRDWYRDKIDCLGICLQLFGHVEHCDIDKLFITGPPVCACDSACFFIWSAGVVRLSNGLGLHRPYFNQNYFKDLSGFEAKNKYEKLSQYVKSYLIKMDIPKDLIDEMFSHGSDEIMYLYDYYGAKMSRKADPYGSVDIPELQYSPFYEEWINAKCGLVLTIEEKEAYNSLWQNRSNLAPTEKIAYEYLRNKRRKRLACEMKARLDTQSSIDD